MFYILTSCIADFVERERERERERALRKAQRPLSKYNKVQSSLSENIRKFASRGTRHKGKRGTYDIYVTCKTATLVFALPFWLDKLFTNTHQIKFIFII